MNSGCNRLLSASSLIALLLATNPVVAQTDTILNRYRQYLFASVLPEKDAIRWITSLNASYQWPDLNYADTARAFWQNTEHIKRVRDLALAWANPHSSYYHRDEVKRAVHNGMEHWLTHRYKNSNWWINEIGVPQYMRDIIVLFQKELSSQELEQSLEVMAQYKLQKSGAGANLTWTADLAFHYGLLKGDEELMKHSWQLMVDEIHFSTGDGIQPDFSFHQHGARLQEYHYGSAFIKSNIRIAWELRGTDWAFPQDKIELMVGFVLNGWRWMSRGIYTVPGTIDRACSRRNALGLADLRDLLPYLEELSPEKSSEFHAMITSQNETSNPLTGFRYYPYSDFSVYHQKNFSFLLKTISSRTLASESINSENLKGKLLNSGDGYTIRNGKEYFNLMPVWDWNLLPGLTSFMGADKIIRNEFSGSVTDSLSGLTAMEYGLVDIEGKSMRARKSWFCHAGLVICLITTLDSSNIAGRIFTAIDQCRWQTDVTSDKQRISLKEGHHSLENVKWLHHAGIGYIFPEPADVELDLKTVTGTWRSINASETDSPVTEKLFVPMLMHKQKSNISYVIAGGKSLEETRKLANKPAWKIIRNDKDCQAVSFADGTIMATFFSASTVRLNKTILSVDHPCLALIKKDKLYCSNPLHINIELKVKHDQSTFALSLPENGITIGR